MVRQYDFADETGIPRLGCFFLVLLQAVFGYAHQELTRVDVMELYSLGLERLFWWADGRHSAIRRPYLEHVGKRGWKTHPQGVLSMAASYVDSGTIIATTIDKWCQYPGDKPWEMEQTYCAVEFDRPPNDLTTDHWLLYDSKAQLMLYNPDDRINVWTRTGRWRPITIRRI